jgi:hypothetical protein
LGWCVLNSSAPNYVNENGNTRGVVDFLPCFRLTGVVNETLENQLYDSLTALAQSLPHDTANEWPRIIWQTSPGKDETPEMTSWKIKNPEWIYQVSFLLSQLMDSTTTTTRLIP